MDDLERKIGRITEELRAVQEELKRAGLLPGSDGIQRPRWPLAYRLGWSYERLRALLHLHDNSDARRALVPVRRP